MNNSETMRLTEKEIRTWAAITHIAAFSFFVLPLGNIFGPLSIWIIKRVHSPFIDFHGKQEVNFQISLTLYVFIAGILIFFHVGIPILVIVFLLGFIIPIVASVKALNGEYYYPPLTIQFIK